jgi:hypothetical protein
MENSRVPRFCSLNPVLSSLSFELYIQAPRFVPSVASALVSLGGRSFVFLWNASFTVISVQLLSISEPLIPSVCCSEILSIAHLCFKFQLLVLLVLK